jgi:hypothetical protein
VADDQAEEHHGREAVTVAPMTPAGNVRRRTRKSTTKKSWSQAKDIDFRPEGKPNMRDFATGKAPANNYERNLVAVYYLEEILAISAIEVGHVLAAFAECEWRPASDPENSLMVTASRKGWLETSDMKAIRLTHRGRSTVQYDLPRISAEKSA